MTKVDEIIPQKLWISNEQSAFEYDILRQLGIKQILTVGKEIKQHDGPVDFAFMRVDIYDSHMESLYEWFGKTKEFIDKGPTLVHCVMGISRSGTVVLSYLMAHEHISFDEAFRKIYKIRGILPNTGFLSDLKKYENELQIKQKTKCHNCKDKSNAIYYFPICKIKADLNETLEIRLACNLCVNETRGHFLGRICFGILPKAYWAIVDEYNKEKFYKQICHVNIDYINGDVQRAFSNFHNTLGIAIKCHPTLEGYIENPLLYFELFYVFYSCEKHSFTIFISQYPLLNLMFSVVIDTWKVIETTTENIIKRNANLMLGYDSNDSKLNFTFQKIVDLIDEYSRGEMTQYIPRYLIESVCNEPDEKYPMLNDKIKKIPAKPFVLMFKEFKSSGSMVMYEPALYAKDFYNFIKETSTK